MVKLKETVVMVGGGEYIEVFGSEAECLFRRVEEADVVRQLSRKGGSLRPPLAFIVHEEECPVLPQGSAGRDAKLILAQRSGVGRGLEKRTGVYRAVLEILVQTAVQSVAA